MMKDGIRRAATAVPFTNPITPPNAIAARVVGTGPHPCWIRSAAATPVSATTEPTDRSIAPLTMIMVMPRAPIETITDCVRMILKLW